MLHEQAAAIAAEAYARVTGNLGARPGDHGTRRHERAHGRRRGVDRVDAAAGGLGPGQARRPHGRSRRPPVRPAGSGHRPGGRPDHQGGGAARGPGSGARRRSRGCSTPPAMAGPGPSGSTCRSMSRRRRSTRRPRRRSSAAHGAGRSTPTPSPRRILDELERARRPVILAGNGVRLAKAIEPLREVVERSGVPLLTSRRNGIDVLPADHPLYFGRPGSMAARYANWALQTADLIVVIGCRLDPVQVAYDWAGFGRNARKVMVDIDEHEIAKITPPIDVPLVADAGPVLRALAARLEADGVPADVAAARAAWADALPRLEGPIPGDRGAPSRPAGPGQHLRPRRGAVRRACRPTDTMVIGSSGAAIETFMLAYSAPLGQRTFLTGGLGAMGFGLPASIGACLGANRGPDGPRGRRRRLPAQHPGAGDAPPARAAGQGLRARQPGLRVHPREPAPALRGPTRRRRRQQRPGDPGHRPRSPRRTGCGPRECRVTPTCLASSTRSSPATTR